MKKFIIISLVASLLGGCSLDVFDSGHDDYYYRSGRGSYYHGGYHGGYHGYHHGGGHHHRR